MLFVNGSYELPWADVFIWKWDINQLNKQMMLQVSEKPEISEYQKTKHLLITTTTTGLVC